MSDYADASDLRAALTYLAVHGFDPGVLGRLGALADDLDAGRVRIVEVADADAGAVPIGWVPSDRWGPSVRKGTLVMRREDGHPVACVTRKSWWLLGSLHSEPSRSLHHGQYLAEQALGAAHDK